MRLMFLLFRAQFRNCVLSDNLFIVQRKYRLETNYCINFIKNRNINLYKMPKRKREVAIEAEINEDVQGKTEIVTSKKSTRTRGKVARHPKPQEVEVENESASESDQEETKKKPAKGKGKKASNKTNVDAVKSDKKERAVKKSKKTNESNDSDSDEIPIKKSKTARGKKNTTNDKPAPKNKTSTSYDEVDFSSCDSKNGKEWNLKISNWNVDGIRAWLKKGGLDYIKYEKPDILCLQETKCSDEKLPEEVKEPEGYKAYWVSSDKDGYAGVGLYSRTEPLSVSYGIGVKEHDSEGRIITAEYDKFYVISVYVPNAGRGLVTLDKRLDWNTHFRTYVSDLDKKKPVIICGDMNVAHTEIDLANPKTNTKNAGFTKEERDGMTEFLGDGYVDTFRHLYPDKTQAYTFWSYMSNARAKNVGWRLDYFVVSKRFVDNVCDNVIRSEVFGSDHCPITLFLAV